MPSAASRDAAPPRRGASQIFGCDFSGTELRKAIVCPSGDQRGELSPAGVIGDLRQRAAVGVDHPDVGVVAHVELLAGAVGHERDRAAVGRPLRIGVVPVVAGR